MSGPRDRPTYHAHFGIGPNVKMINKRSMTHHWAYRTWLVAGSCQSRVGFEPKSSRVRAKVESGLAGDKDTFFEKKIYYANMLFSQIRAID